MFGRSSPKKSDNTRYYEILGVSKTASHDELKRAYKKAAIKNHPDKGGDPEKFKELAQAYEVLSVPEKRQIYDEYGEDALKEGMYGGDHDNDLFQIFSEMLRGGRFGGEDGGRGRGKQKRGEDLVHPLEVSLEDLYVGITKKMSISSNVTCSKCSGKSSKSGVSMTCGEAIDPKDTCQECKGEKVVPEKKVLHVVVEKGMKNGQKITFPGEADETITGGDIVFMIQQTEHQKFIRKGDDLFCVRSLTLTEALCGFRFALTHLDGRKLLIKSTPGEVVTPDSYKAIDDEGMPVYQRPFMRGKLYINFNVEFPYSLTEEQREKILLDVLPMKTCNELTEMEIDECEETRLHDVNIEEEMMRRRESESRCHEAYDEDDEMLGQSVQCAQ